MYYMEKAPAHTYHLEIITDYDYSNCAWLKMFFHKMETNGDRIAI